MRKDLWRKTKSRRSFLKALAAAGAGAAGVGMLGTRRPASAAALAAAPGVQKPVKLSLFFPYNTDTERDVFLKRIEMFRKDNPSITLSIQHGTWMKMSEIVQARVIAGDEPDVILSTVARLAFYAPKLRDWAPMMPAGLEKEFNKAAWDGTKLGGKLTGLPSHGTVRGVVYNVDYFEKAGLKAPKTKADSWTWEQMSEAAKTLQQKAGAKYGLQFEKKSFDGFLPIIHQNGGSLLNEAQTAPAIQEKAGVEAIRWAADLHQKGLAAPGLLDGTEDPLKLFASGISAMWLGASNVQISALAAQMTKFRWDYMVMPRHPYPLTAVVNVQWAAFQKADPEAAWKFMSYMTGPDAMTEISSTSGYLPPRPALRDKVKWRAGAALLPLFLDMAEWGYSARLQAEVDGPIYGGAKDQMQTELSNAATGQMTAEAAAQAMAKILSNTIKKAAA
jgi:ABC-type glycerol-3-phosphate transport system substrate-binding protein